MTQKIYRTAKGKTVDFGSLRLQNEHVRAVGNMGVNTRGDRIDANGNVIDSANDQLQRRMKRQSNVSNGPVHTSERAQQEEQTAAMAAATTAPVAVDPMAAMLNKQSNTQVTTEDTATGLAAAISRSKTVKQELEKTSREKQQDHQVRKI
jgi:hypothetical protein